MIGSELMKKELNAVPQVEDYRQHTIYASFLPLRRLNLIMEQVLRYTQQKQVSQLKVLDLGCGIGGMTSSVGSLGYQVVGVDLDPETISLCQSRNTFPNATYIVGNAETLDLREKFDVVIASELIEHCNQPRLVMLTLSRHLVEGGIGIVSVPSGYCLRELIFNRFIQKLGIASLYHKLPKRVNTFLDGLTGLPGPFLSLKLCPHVQFFSFGKFKGLLDSSGFQVLRVRNLSLGLLLDWPWLNPLKRIECKLADFVPHPLAGGWLFVIKQKDE